MPITVSTRKYNGLDLRPEEFREPADLARLPFVTKAELAADQHDHPPYGSILTYSPTSYSRLHQTSGTSTGRPLCWLDTPRSWDRLLHCWLDTFPSLGITRNDRFFFPFSFGPFLGFWTAFEAAGRAGIFCLAGGGMSGTARLRFLLDHHATVIFCTPTYALHLAELAAQEGIDLAGSEVRLLVVAGEPGGNIPATRERIEEVWGARVIDHYGMTEVGPVATEPLEHPGALQALEEHYLLEVIELEGTGDRGQETGDRGQETGDREQGTGNWPLLPGLLSPVPCPLSPSSPATAGELVITNLGRTGSPLIRYRTGDIVRLSRRLDDRPTLEGGILGRVDDMIHLRGNNVYPASIEAVIRGFPEVAEFRLIVDQSKPLTDLRIEIEPVPPADGPALAEVVARAVRDVLLFRVEVDAVEPGTLPRFELKARRVVRGFG